MSAATVRPVPCKVCGKRLLDTDGRGYIEVVCRDNKCKAFNVVKPQDLPTRRGRATLPSK